MYHNELGDQLKEKMIGAIAWSSVDRVAQQLVQFIIGVILARLLSPTDYGMIGMVMIFASLSYVLVESGFSSALVRTTHLTSVHCNSVFFANLGVSLFLYGLLFFTAPAIADFFGQEELIGLTRVTCLAILFNAFYLVPFAINGRRMDYKSLTKVNLFGTIISGAIGIGLAFMGFGVWALSIQQLCYHFFRCIGSFIWVRWWPTWEFSWKVIKDYLPFSSHILGSSLLTIIFNNLYTFILGKFYSINQLGFYTKANKLSETANFTFISIFGGTSYNLFAQIHEDKERVVRVLNTMVKKASLIVLPIMLFLIANAHSIILTILGEKWAISVPYFQLICAANLFTCIYGININALNSIGKSRLSFHIEFIKRIFILVSIVIGLRFGIAGLLLGNAVSCLLAWVTSMIGVKMQTQCSVWIQFKNNMAGLLWGTGIAIISYHCSLLVENIYLQLVIACAVFGLAYLVILRQYYQDVYSLLLNQLRKK